MRFYRDTLGLQVRRLEMIEEQGVKAALLVLGNSEIELLEPVVPDTGIARYLEHKGEGLHHLCFQVDSVEEACRRLRSAGMKLAGSIREGSEGARIAFLHPRDSPSHYLAEASHCRERSGRR